MCLFQKRSPILKLSCFSDGPKPEIKKEAKKEEAAATAADAKPT